VKEYFAWIIAESGMVAIGSFHRGPHDFCTWPLLPAARMLPLFVRRLMEDARFSTGLIARFPSRDAGGRVPAGQFAHVRPEDFVILEQRLAVVIPFTLLIIFVLIFINTRSAIKTIIVMLAVPFSLVDVLPATGCDRPKRRETEFPKIE
jgi:hypothetical protein